MRMGKRNASKGLGSTHRGRGRMGEEEVLIMSRGRRKIGKDEARVEGGGVEKGIQVCCTKDMKI